MKTILKVCQNCVMDTSDPNISFDNNGICNHCNNFKKNINPFHQKLQKNKSSFLNTINQIKTKNKKKRV